MMQFFVAIKIDGVRMDIVPQYDTSFCGVLESFERPCETLEEEESDGEESETEEGTSAVTTTSTTSTSPLVDRVENKPVLVNSGDVLFEQANQDKVDILLVSKNLNNML
jgi:hypothetical protein